MPVAKKSATDIASIIKEELRARIILYSHMILIATSFSHTAMKNSGLAEFIVCCLVGFCLYEARWKGTKISTN